MKEQLESHRFKEGKRFFIYAPPLRGTSYGGKPSKRLPPNPPFNGAPSFKTSVYYYWWEFLRRSEEYKKCCESGGKGELSQLYTDFGNVFEEADGPYGKEFHTFWNWWTGKHPVSRESRGQTLFAEPPGRKITEAVSSTALSNDTLVVEVPLELRTAVIVNQFRKLLAQHDKRHKTAQAKSRALYPVYTKPVLTALHTALTVHDAYQENQKIMYGKKKLWQLFDQVSQQLDFFHVSDRVTFSKVAGGKGFRNISEETFELSKMERAKSGGTLNYEDEGLLLEIREVVRTRKANAIKRQQRIAAQYIANVEHGVFPMKTHR